MVGGNHAEGGQGTKSLGVILTQVLEVLAILKRGVKRVLPLKKWGGGHRRSYCGNTVPHN